MAKKKAEAAEREAARAKAELARMKRAEAVERAKEAREAREAREKAEAAKRTYVVKSGDSLSKIARDVMGDAGRWPEIFEANKDKIKDPNLIYPGQELTIPSDED